jgi:hypothetical protein
LQFEILDNPIALHTNKVRTVFVYDVIGTFNYSTSELLLNIFICPSTFSLGADFSVQLYEKVPRPTMSGALTFRMFCAINIVWGHPLRITHFQYLLAGKIQK